MIIRGTILSVRGFETWWATGLENLPLELCFCFLRPCQQGYSSLTSFCKNARMAAIFHDWGIKFAKLNPFILTARLTGTLTTCQQDKNWKVHHRYWLNVGYVMRWWWYPLSTTRFSLLTAITNNLDANSKVLSSVVPVVVRY